ncbi:hypothetical protein FRB94_004537, partial [Tulasnella sp. JGI-2019a]
MSFVIRMTGKELERAYQAVRSGDPNFEWALYTVRDGSTELVVQETGAGGLDELCSRFDDSREQHAYARVEDPRAHGDKFVLINWCGEDAPQKAKRFFAMNSTAIGGFLRGAQFTLNALHREDLSPEEIMKKLVGHGSSGEAPRGASMFRRPTQQSPATRPLQNQFTGSSRADIGEMKRTTSPGPILLSSPVSSPVALSMPQPKAHISMPEARTSPNPFSETPTEPVSLRPVPTRGMTWGERLAARRRDSGTMDDERAKQAIFEGSVRRGETISPTPLSWSQRQQQAKKREEEEQAVKAAQAE